MIINKVTFTGADDNTDISDLEKISAKYRIVEWGILLSSSSMKNTRFPSLAWMNDLASAQLTYGYINLSGHLCGAWLRDLVKGQDNFSNILPMDMFDRIQLNFHGGKVQPVPEFYHILEKLRKKIIFQIDGANTDIYKEAIDRGIDAYPFFDLSHGAGVLPEHWDMPLDDRYCGYAGGLGPDNIDLQLAAINNTVEPDSRAIWIDMETNVRSTVDKKDVFDFDKIMTCLMSTEVYW